MNGRERIGKRRGAKKMGNSGVSSGEDHENDNPRIGGGVAMAPDRNGWPDAAQASCESKGVPLGLREAGVEEVIAVEAHSRSQAIRGRTRAAGQAEPVPAVCERRNNATGRSG